jgi:hypothetical protein
MDEDVLIRSRFLRRGLPLTLFLAFLLSLLGQVAVSTVVLIDIYLTKSPLNNGAPPGYPARVRGDDVVSPSM